MKVRDAMGRSVRSIRPDTKIVEVASPMCLYRFHGLPVVDDDEQLVGVPSLGDVHKAIFHANITGTLESAKAA